MAKTVKTKTPRTSPTKTPPRHRIPYLMYVRTQSPQDIADLFGVNEKTVRRWCGRPREEYRCPHDRMEDGRLLLNADEVQNWQDRTGIDGKPGRPEFGNVGSDCDFWICIVADYPPATEATLITDFERDILAGTRTLSADEVQEYVQHNLNLREGINRQINERASWLLRVGSTKEMQARLRSIFYERIDFTLEQIYRMLDEQDGAERDGNTGELNPPAGPAKESK